MGCKQCELQTAQASAAVDVTNVGVTAVLIGAAIVGIYYLSKVK